MTNQDSFAQASGYQMEIMDDEILLYDAERKRVVYCNGPAALVWQLCDGQRTVQEIIDLIAAAYPDAGTDIAQDVEATVRDFVAQGVLEPA